MADKALDVLVVGGAGFIGHHLVHRLVADLHRVRVLDCFHDAYDPHRKWTNLRNLLRDERIQLVVGDVRDRTAVDRALARSTPGDRVDVIVHLATTTTAAASFANAAECLDVAATGTTKLLDAAQEHDVRQVIFASSSAVYGAATAPLTEDTVFTPPTSPYTVAKRTLESVAEMYGHDDQLRVTVARLFSVFGPGQPDTMFIPTALTQRNSGAPLCLFGGGSAQIDLVYVDDAVSGLLSCINRPGASFRTYNIGNGQGVTVTAIVDELERLLGKSIARVTAPARRGDAQTAVAVIDRARNELGFVPTVPWRDGLARLTAAATR